MLFIVIAAYAALATDFLETLFLRAPWRDLQRIRECSCGSLPMINRSLIVIQHLSVIEIHMTLIQPSLVQMKHPATIMAHCSLLLFNDHISSSFLNFNPPSSSRSCRSRRPLMAPGATAPPWPRPREPRVRFEAC